MRRTGERWGEEEMGGWMKRVLEKEVDLGELNTCTS